jgi:hypothetical protein
MTHQIDPTAFQAVIADLHQRLSDSHREKQRLIHENERLRAELGNEVRAARVDAYGLVVNCDNPTCSTPPLRIKVPPPEDAVAQWVRGMSWVVDGDNHWCPGCAP